MAKVMVIDKDEDVSVRIVKLFIKEGYEAMEVTDLDKIFARIYAFRPDVFIVGESCKEAMDQLKFFEPTSHLPVVSFQQNQLDLDQLLIIVKETLESSELMPQP